MNKIEFIDLQAQRLALGSKIPQVIEQVIAHGAYILGPEVLKLENELCAYSGATDVVTCSNGTDALRLLLLAKNIGPGDAVFVPTFTFASTAEVVAQANATPIFVDICPETYNLDVHSLQQALDKLDRNKLTPKGIIAVDLFGLPADYASIHDIANANNLWVIADAAQSFGGNIHGQKVGTLAHMTSASFFPSKPLACYGDGGAIFTNDKQTGDLIRSLRNHGCGVHRYDHIHVGLNSRLDTIQAAILLEKLKIFPQELQRRHEIASFYTDSLKNIVSTPQVEHHRHHAWGLYTIACQTDQREHMIQYLQSQKIPTNVYYRKPLHLQPAYQHFPRANEKLLGAELSAGKVLSLPMHPYLTDLQLEFIVANVKQSLS